MLGEQLGVQMHWCTAPAFARLQLRHTACIACSSHLQGGNTYGQIGDGTTSNRLSPTLVYFDGWWSTLATGDLHTCGIRTDGALWCWVRTCLCVPAASKARFPELPLCHVCRASMVLARWAMAPLPRRCCRCQ